MILDSKSAKQQLQTVEAENTVNQILDDNMQFLMDTYMIPEVKRAAQAANIPQPFVDGIKFTKTGSNEGDIINTWGTTEKPLALWFNYGTRDHGPLGNWELRWKGKSGKEIHAKFVRGVPKTLAMEIGIELGTKRLILEVPRFVEERLE